MAGPIYFDEPPAARRLFGSTTFAWLWLVLRLYLGWEWLVSGWAKTFGGNITWKFWNWVKPFFMDPRYLRVDNKPVLSFYKSEKCSKRTRALRTR